MPYCAGLLSWCKPKLSSRLLHRVAESKHTSRMLPPFPMLMSRAPSRVHRLQIKKSSTFEPHATMIFDLSYADGSELKGFNGEDIVHVRTHIPIPMAETAASRGAAPPPSPNLLLFECHRVMAPGIRLQFPHETRLHHIVLPLSPVGKQTGWRHPRQGALWSHLPVQQSRLQRS